MTPLYGHTFPNNNSIEYNDATEGEPIERRVERIMSQNEPITDGAPIIYTKRSDGVQPQYNVRTDRWDYALDMTNEITRQALVKREEFHKTIQQQQNPPTGATPSAGTKPS